MWSTSPTELPSTSKFRSVSAVPLKMGRRHPSEYLRASREDRRIMKSKRLRLRLGAMGTLLLVPRALCVAASSSRITDDDARVALEPLNRIHLGKVDQGPISVRRVVWCGRTLGRRTAH